MRSIVKKICAVAAAVTMLFAAAAAAYAQSGVQPLQAYFTADGKTMKIFVSERLDESASLLVGNEVLAAEQVVNSNVAIRTTFLIDNSGSIPEAYREQIKSSVIQYVSRMSPTESVRIVMFDTEVEYLADYTNDKSYIDYELSKLTFTGRSSLVYDAVLNVVQSIEPTDDAYYRTILFTDGIDSTKGTSFDYLRSVISDNGRYHIDVVQVSKKETADVNLTAIANLGSNTMTLFWERTDLSALRPDTVSMLKVKLTNSVTTGELKGVTIKNGSGNIPLGSILFPQVEIDSPQPSAPSSAANTNAAATTSTTSKEFPFVPVLVAVGVVVAAGVAAIIVVAVKKASQQFYCVVSVNITKQSQSDVSDVGPHEWSFDSKNEYRVGRARDPKDNDGTPLPKNDFIIVEYEEVSSIGRNAFSLSCDKKTGVVTIKNIARGAVFALESSHQHMEMNPGRTAELKAGDTILVGSYTTVYINNIRTLKK